MKSTALIFRYELLPTSETFIKSQAGALRDFQACYAGIERAPNGLPIPDDAVVLMNGKSFRNRIERRAFLIAGWAPRFYQRLRDKGPVLIHAHFATDGVFALPLISEFRIPLIVTLHGYDVTSSETFLNHGTGRLYLKRRQRLFEQASLFICISDFIRQKALSAGFPNSKLRVHHIGVDCSFFNPVIGAHERDLVLFAGRLVEQKGCRYLIEAMKLIQQKCPRAMLIVIGDGPGRRSFMNLAEQAAISCKFLGIQPPDAVREWLGRARVFCVPSVTGSNGAQEGLGTVFAEAQAMGVPVVSSKIGGIPEVVKHGETGLLAPERDSKSLADNLLRYLMDDGFWAACSTRAIEWTRERFDLHRQTRELENIYRQIICRRVNGSYN